MDKAIPIGLILNELALNSLNFAFDENEYGNFHVKFRLMDGMYEVDVWMMEWVYLMKLILIIQLH